MQFPERFSDLPEYAFPRLRTLLAGTPPGGPELAMSIGEPKHPVPAVVAETIAAHAAEFGRYPPNDGAPELLASIAAWLARRYGVTVDPETQLLALNGSYISPYGTPLGQLILGVLLVSYLAGLMWLRSMTQGQPLPRFLGRSPRSAAMGAMGAARAMESRSGNRGVRT